MSALAMILTAAMLVPGDRPESGSENTSGEVEERLDLSGEWKGTWQIWEGSSKTITLRNGKLGFGGFELPADFEIEKQEEKSLRIQWAGRPFFGIYKYSDNGVRICLRNESNGPPGSFRFGEERVILTLHRVKPRK